MKQSKLYAVFIATAAVIAACGGAATSEGEPATPAPPADEAEQQPDTNVVDAAPVEIVAELRRGDDGVFLEGRANLPDGAAVLYEILLSSEEAFESMTPEQTDLYFDGQEGFAVVSSEQFAVEIEGWLDVPVCMQSTDAESGTDIFVYFVPVKEYVEAVGPIYGPEFAQPDVVFDLYGSEGENLEAVSPAEVVDSFLHDGKEVRVMGTCAPD